jgi:acetyl-CoA C-acetyltransferase
VRGRSNQACEDERAFVARRELLWPPAEPVAIFAGMSRIAIVDAVRTPIGKLQGALSPLRAVDLGRIAVQGLLARTGVAAEEVEELIFGQARQLGSGPNPARQVAIAAGLGEACPAMTVNKACGSSLKAIDLARAALLLDDRRVVVAGGVESMTNIPFLLPQMRQGYRLGHGKVLDGNFTDGFTCGILGQPMGMTAEYLADDYGLTRDAQDEYALASHHRAAAAQAAGVFDAEIVPVEVPGPRGSTTSCTVDEHVRGDVTREALGRLAPVFRPDGGTVHAGNSSGVTDGASALLMMTETEVERRGLTPLAFLGASATAGVSPRIMGIGPVPAVHKLCAKTGRNLDEFDLVELNEAFAAQVLACLHDLPIDPERLNVHGGAIALGHPIGATGARIVTTLLHAMKRRGARRGLATLCMSGGMGMALEFESA